jgi:hypothetical protein
LKALRDSHKFSVDIGGRKRPKTGSKLRSDFLYTYGNYHDIWPCPVEGAALIKYLLFKLIEGREIRFRHQFFGPSRILPDDQSGLGDQDFKGPRPESLRSSSRLG